MKYRITFDKKGHDDFVDFIKAYAIICVLIDHTIGQFLGNGVYALIGMQVPLFLLIQVFHFYKKDVNVISIKKIVKRVIIPFAIVQGLILCILFLKHGCGCNSLIIKWLIGGVWPWFLLPLGIFTSCFAITPLWGYTQEE